MSTNNDPTLYEQVGWWIPGSLKPRWDANFHANFNDIDGKMEQLGLVPLVRGLMPNQAIGFYFSMAEFDYIQLLTVKPLSGKQATVKLPDALASYTIVAYSVWMSSQGWSGFSPIPIMELQGVSEDEYATPMAFPEQTYYPAGRYLIGELSQRWFQNIQKNYRIALEKRIELNFNILSPLYHCQSSIYDCIQMLQAPHDEGVPRAGAIQEYVAWFNGMGFGNLKAIPFMSETLLEEAINIAHKTP